MAPAWSRSTARTPSYSRRSNSDAGADSAENVAWEPSLSTTSSSSTWSIVVPWTIEIGEAEGLEPVEPVAAGLAPVARVVRGDGARMVAQHRPHAVVQPPLELGRRRRFGRERRLGAVAQHDLELEHVVDRRPVDD